ncbi:MAG: rhomboid family intramembrane serine protease [Candidatus Caldatribacteriota bacterium]|nr:rhomboid family intramembrane serine protease [Candidatus Caldatribacteriota bacterium]
MFPIYDDVPTKRLPIITIAIIVINAIVYFYQISLGDGYSAFIYCMGLIPYEISHNMEILKSGPSLIYSAIFSSMFIHGSFIHLAGNMLFLWIFGNNVEDYIGRVNFIIFYFICGIASALTQVLTDLNSTIPVIGASGAIAGILGAYLVLYPKAKVNTLIIFGFFIRIIKIPAVVVLSFWIIYQFLYGLSSLAERSGEGGTAWFAHIGGFIMGFLLIKIYNFTIHTRR